MKRAVAYCRVSTEGQTKEDKFGIQAQKDQITEYCNTHDIEIIDWFVDTVSGAKEDRPEFDKIFYGGITNPPVEYVIVAKTDRIARDVNLYYAYKSKLKSIGIEILSVAEDWSAQDKLTAMILENFMAIAATIERENIRMRMTGGRKQKAKRGGYSGGKTPMGYKAEGGKLVVNEEEAKVVRYIFEQRRSGGTMLGIVDSLNKLGFKTRKGKEFVLSTVQSILNNEKTYLGYYKYGKDGEWVQGEHEPLLKEI